MEDWPSGRLGMLGEAVNNWGQGTLDLDHLGRWALGHGTLAGCRCRTQQEHGCNATNQPNPGSV